MIFQFFLLCGVIIFLLLLIRNVIEDYYTDRPPGPFRIPGLGNLVQIVMANKTYPFKAMQQLGERYGSMGIIRLQLGVVEAVSINGYKAIKQVLTNNDDWIGRMDEDWILDRTFNKQIGIIFGSVEHWKETRRFSLRLLREYGFGVKNTMESLTIEELEEFCTHISNEAEANNGVVLMNCKFHTFTLNTTWALVTGDRYHLKTPNAKKLIMLVESWSRKVAFAGNILSAYPFLVWLAPSLTGYNTLHDINVQMQQYLQTFMAEIRLKGKYLHSPENFIEAYMKKIDETKMESDPHNAYTDEALISILFDFFLAGSETTSHELSYSILFMTLNQEVQEKVQEEIDQIVGRSNLPKYEHAMRMPYTQATILEVFRMGDVVPIGPRKLHTNAKFGPYKVPKGTVVFLNFHSAHFDTTIWKDPLCFRPERFLDSNMNIINDDKLFTFSAGKRNCFGEPIAKMTVFLFFVGLLQKFKFEIDPITGPPSVDPMPGITNSAKPFNVILKSRV